MLGLFLKRKKEEGRDRETERGGRGGGVGRINSRKDGWNLNTAF